MRGKVRNWAYLVRGPPLTPEAGRRAKRDPTNDSRVSAGDCEHDIGRLTLDDRGDPCDLRRTHGRGRLFEIDWLRARPKLGGRRRRGLRLRSRGSRFGRGRDKAAGDGAGCAACLAKS